MKRCVRLYALRFQDPTCKVVRPQASNGGKPPIPGPSTFRLTPTPDKKMDVAKGLPMVDTEQCPS